MVSRAKIPFEAEVDLLLTGNLMKSLVSSLQASSKYSTQKLKICSSGCSSAFSALFLNFEMSSMLPIVDLRYLWGE